MVLLSATFFFFWGSGGLLSALDIQLLYAEFNKMIISWMKDKVILIMIIAGA